MTNMSRRGVERLMPPSFLVEYVFANDLPVLLLEGRLAENLIGVSQAIEDEPGVVSTLPVRFLDHACHMTMRVAGAGCIPMGKAFLVWISGTKQVRILDCTTARKGWSRTVVCMTGGGIVISFCSPGPSNEGRGNILYLGRVVAAVQAYEHCVTSPENIGKALEEFASLVSVEIACSRMSDSWRFYLFRAQAASDEPMLEPRLRMHFCLEMTSRAS